MSKFKASIGLINPKSPSNVGAVMRAAGCYQAHDIFYTGERFKNAAKFHTDTQKAGLTIPLTHVDELINSVPEGAQIVCVELVEGAIALPEYQHPDQAFYIFGPEDGNVKQKVVDQADAVVYVPTVGCLNLAQTVNVVLYDRMVKSGFALAGDALIRSSRDVNNKVKVSNADRK
ncbi:MAG: RNA methyltransferase [Gammaproteobacteria bacterium]|nr:RNA methyltransferase [Gammaproteobacteria bacterium]